MLIYERLFDNLNKQAPKARNNRSKVFLVIQKYTMIKFYMTYQE
jgi:hypothetical protein